MNSLFPFCVCFLRPLVLYFTRSYPTRCARFIRRRLINLNVFLFIWTFRHKVCAKLVADCLRCGFDVCSASNIQVSSRWTKCPTEPWLKSQFFWGDCCVFAPIMVWNTQKEDRSLVFLRECFHEVENICLLHFKYPNSQFGFLYLVFCMVTVSLWALLPLVPLCYWIVRNYVNIQIQRFLLCCYRCSWDVFSKKFGSAKGVRTDEWPHRSRQKGVSVWTVFVFLTAVIVLLSWYLLRTPVAAQSHLNPQPSNTRSPH